MIKKSAGGKSGNLDAIISIVLQKHFYSFVLQEIWEKAKKRDEKLIKWTQTRTSYLIQMFTSLIPFTTGS